MTTAIDYRLLLVQPNVVFAARCTQVSIPGSAAWYVTYDRVSTGAHTDIRAEMMVLLGTSAGADDLGRARVRKAATSDTIFIGWSSFGRGEGELHIQYDAYITVIDLYKPWTKTPRIENGVQYTDYDRDFASYGHSAPVVNLDCGPAVQRDLDPDTGLATFEFSAVHTYMTDPDAAAMYSAFDWELPAEATVTDGAINTHAVTFTLPEGAWWVSAYETASTGTVGARRVLCVAGEPSGTIRAFDEVEIVRRPEGQTLRVRVSEHVPRDTYPNGCMAVLLRRQTEDGAEITPGGLTGHERIAFVGWHYQDETSARAEERGFVDDTHLEFRDVGGWLQLLPGYPITVNRSQTPATWFDLKRANIDYYCARLLLEYTNVVTLTDWLWSGLGYDHYPFPSLASLGSTLYEQVDGRAQAIAHKLTCDQWGRLHIRPDPMLLDAVGGSTPVARTTAVQQALTETDWSEMELSAQYFPRANWNWGNAVVAKSVDAALLPQIDTVFCVAPGRAPGQGTATQQTNEQLVTGQAELNAREGHRYATMNRPYPSLDITLAGPDDWAIQPAWMEWVTFSNSAATAGQRQHVFSAVRLLPIEVSITHDAERSTQRVIVRGEIETTGAAAATYYPPSDDYGDLPEWELPPIYEPDPGDADLGPGLNKLVLIHRSGEVSITSNFQAKSVAGGPSYTVVDLSLDGDVLDAVTDPYSPLYLGTGTTVNAWVVTATRIYYVEDVAGVSSRSVTSQHTFAVETDYRTIQTERGVANWVLVSSYYTGTGVMVARTTDGSTWNEVSVLSGGAGDLLDTFSVPGAASTGADSTVSLSAGITYLVRVTGVIARGSGFKADAQYGTDDDWATYTRDNHINLDGLAYATAIDGTYNDAHSYDFLVTGDGTTINITFIDFPYGDNSGSWTVEIFGDITLSPQTPTLHTSGKTAGLAYTGAASGSVGRLYKTTNYGASWYEVSLPASDFGQSLGGAFHFPWHNNPSDLLYYWGKFAASVYSAHRTETNGATKTPLPLAEGYGPASPKCWSSSPVSRQVMAVASDNGTQTRVDVSQDGGDSWTLVSPPIARASGYTGVHIADETAILYLWGPGGVAYSGSGGLLIDDRSGNASASEVVAIGGW